MARAIQTSTSRSRDRWVGDGDRRPLDPTIFSTFRLESFDDGRVRRLVTRTLSATTPGLSPDDMDDVAEAFMRDTAPLADIRTNPAFLALALSLYEGRGSLPLNRAELCGELLERMLGGSGDAGRVVRYFLPSTIGYLAFWLISERNDQPAVAEHKLFALVADYLRSRLEDREEAGDVAQGLVRYLRNRSGLLRPVGITSDGEQLYAFLHRSFMEYSAATHLAATVAGPDDLAAELAERLTETQWFDVGLFAILMSTEPSSEASNGSSGHCSKSSTTFPLNIEYGLRISCANAPS